MRRDQFAKLPMLLVFPVLACSSAAARGPAPPAAQASASVAVQAPAGALPTEVARTPAEALALAEQAYESRLGASRGQFSVDRQVAVLQQEILLYSQFLERAEGEPELEPAVRKSRERIADAEDTLIFLQRQQRGQVEAPPASTP